MTKEEILYHNGVVLQELKDLRSGLIGISKGESEDAARGRRAWLKLNAIIREFEEYEEYINLK